MSRFGRVVDWQTGEDVAEATKQDWMDSMTVMYESYNEYSAGLIEYDDRLCIVRGGPAVICVDERFEEGVYWSPLEFLEACDDEPTGRPELRECEEGWEDDSGLVLAIL